MSANSWTHPQLARNVHASGSIQKYLPYDLKGFFCTLAQTNIRAKESPVAATANHTSKVKNKNNIKIAQIAETVPEKRYCFCAILYPQYARPVCRNSSTAAILQTKKH